MLSLFRIMTYDVHFSRSILNLLDFAGSLLISALSGHSSTANRDGGGDCTRCWKFLKVERREIALAEDLHAMLVLQSSKFIERAFVVTYDAVRFASFGGMLPDHALCLG